MAVPVLSAAGWYMQELIKYPPQFRIGFISNNPPVYNLLPKAKELLEKNGVGRANP
jgi:arylsulfatase